MGRTKDANKTEMKDAEKDNEAPQRSWIKRYPPAPPRTGPFLKEGKLKEIIDKTTKETKKGDPVEILPGTDLNALDYELHRCIFYRKFLSAQDKHIQRAKSVAEIQKKIIDSVINLPDQIVPKETKQLLEETKANADTAAKRKDEFSEPVIAMHWVVGKYLAGIYERTFGRPAAFSHHGTTQEPCGPFVRFAETTLGATDIKYSAWSFKEALARVAEVDRILHGSQANQPATHVTS